MAARVYVIQHSTEYFAAGRNEPKTQQVLLGIQGSEIVCLFFDDQGELLGLEARAIPADATVDAINAAIAAWMLEVGVKPGTIYVKKFSVPDRVIEIRDYPDYLQEFMADPSSFDAERSANLSRCLRLWQENQDYVLVWDEEYEMNARGEIEST